MVQGPYSNINISSLGQEILQFWNTLLGQMSTVHTFTCYSFEIHFNITLPSTISYPKRSL